MTAEQLLKSGQLNEAIEMLSGEIRNDPTDLRRRTFLFELLCFAGEYARAEKQLEILSTSGPQSELGALLYRGALAAERTRQEMFEGFTYPKSKTPQKESSFLINGHPCSLLTDADPRIGQNLELIVAGSYTWLPLAMVETVQIEPPKRLRDLLWVPVTIQTTSAFQGREMSSVLLPALSPGSWKSEDPEVRLGRVTIWQSGPDELIVPLGQKLIRVDEEELPILEIREIRKQAATAQTT